MRGVKQRAGGTWTEALYQDLHEHFKVVEGSYLIRTKALRGNCTPTGVRIGSRMSNGYRQTSWKGFERHGLLNVQLEHRVIYFMVYGDLPEQIDHIDGRRDNNHVLNLRASNNRDNQMNRHKKVGKDPDLPIGVYRVKRKGRDGIWYAVTMEYNGKKRSTLRRDKEAAIELMQIWRAEHAEKTSTQ